MTNFDNDVRIHADQLSAGLRELHRALIVAEAGEDFSQQNPYTFLFAVIGDARFAWINGLTQLIVRLDEAIAEGEISSGEQLEPFRSDASRLLGGGADADFRLRHLMAIQRAADVAIATGGLRRALADMPAVREAA